MTAEEREAVIARLNTSRDRLRAALSNVSDAQAQFTPEDGRWSILQLTEHLAASDDALVAVIRRALDSPAAPELMEKAQSNDHRFKGEFKPLPRGVNKAPESIQPKSKFATVAEALAAFEAGRARTLTFAQQTTDDLRSHFAPHPVLGPMDGYQWLIATAIHVESHLLQIDAVKADAAYPPR